MATPNVGILTTAGKALIDKVNSGQAKISFSKVVFSSMDNSQLSDTQVKALTAIYPQEVVVSPPETTLDTTSGETRIRATGTNKQLADDVYVKTYGVFAKDETGNEVLYGVAVSPNPNYFPAYDGVTPQAVTYSYKTVIQETSNITMTNSNDVYVTQEDLTEAIQKNTSKFLEIPDDTDLFSLVANDAQSHYYLCSSNASVKTLKNCPVTTAFSLELYPANIPQSVASNGVAEWAYTQMVLRPFNSSTAWLASTNTDGAGNISSTDWAQVSSVADVNSAISTATANMVDSSKPTNFTAGLQSGGVDVATAADLKSIENSAWRRLDFGSDVNLGGALLSSYIIYQLHEDEKYISFFYLGVSQSVNKSFPDNTTLMDLSSIVKGISSIDFSTQYTEINDDYGQAANFKISGTKIITSTSSHKVYITANSTVSLYPLNHDERRIYYTELV